MFKKTIPIVTVLAVGAASTYGLFGTGADNGSMEPFASQTAMQNSHDGASSFYNSASGQSGQQQASRAAGAYGSRAPAFDRDGVNDAGDGQPSDTYGAYQTVSDNTNYGYDQGQASQAGGRVFPAKAANHNGDSFFLKPGGESVRATSAEEVKSFLLSQGGKFFKLGAQDDLKTTEQKYDDLGNSFYTFQQTYKGLPVYGKVTVVRTDNNDDIKLVTGRFQSEVDLDTTPNLNGRDAVIQALYNEPVQPASEPVIHYEPELQVFVQDDKSQPVLAYDAIVEYHSTDSNYHFEEVLVDANSGRLLKSYQRIETALTRQVYTAENKPCLNLSGQNINSVIPGDLSFNEGGAAGADRQESGAYTGTGATYWFYYYMYGRDSYDDRGIRIRSTVHAQFAQDNFGFNCSGLNAFYLPEPHDQVVFGNGDATGGLSEAMDAVGHELTHGVTHYTSDLKYEKESGALNEALSDIFGAGVEAWSQSGGNENGNPATLKPNSKTWILCDVCSSNLRRYMNNPTQDNRSKDTYSQRYQGTDDNGGVHINSGIINLAFYLLSEGGSHPRLNTGKPAVNGVGFEKALRIYYDANTTLFRAITNTSKAFTDARNLLAEAAETRYGQCSDEWLAVEQSLDQVGVPGTWTSCDSSGNPTPQPSPAPTPTPTPAPSPSPAPSPTPTPSPTPNPGPFPSPIPGPFPGPYPTPVPTPVPGPFPGPFPSPFPVPGPFPAPSPFPVPGPFPAPSPFPVPGPFPAPTPFPVPGPFPAPSPFPSPFPAPSPYPSPFPAPYPSRVTYPVPSPYPSPVFNTSKVSTPVYKLPTSTTRSPYSSKYPWLKK